MRPSASKRNWIWAIPLAYFAGNLLWVLADPSDLRFPYPVWEELANQWKRFASGVGLLAILWVLGRSAFGSRAIDYLAGRPAVPCVLLFTLAGLALRLLWCWFAPNMPYADGESMWKEAINLFNGNGYSINGVDPTAYRPPGYPIFLAGLFHLFGVHLFGVKIVQAFLSAGAIPMMFLLAERIFGRAVAVLTAAFTAFAPMAIVSSSLIMNEHLYLWMALPALLLLLSDLDRPKAVKLVAAGVLLGLSVLTRSVMTLVLVLLVFWYLYARLPWRDIARRMLLIGIPFILAIVPWTIRNYVTMGYPIVVCSSAGHALGGDQNDTATPYDIGFTKFAHLEPGHRNLHPNLEVANHIGGMRSGLKWMAAHPLRVMKMQAAKMVCLYGITTVWPVQDNFYSLGLGDAIEPFTQGLEKGISLFYSFHLWAFLVGLGLLAWALRKKRDTAKVLLLLLFLYWAFLHGTFHAEKRYRYVIEPFVYMMASSVAVALLSGRRTSI